MATVQRDVPFGTATSGSGQQLLCDVWVHFTVITL